MNNLANPRGRSVGGAQDKDSNKDSFSSALKKALGDKGTVKNFELRASLEIQDLDSLTIIEEFETAKERALGENVCDFKVSLT